MKNFSPLTWVASTLALSLASSVSAREDTLVTAVFSGVHNGYVRETTTDGAVKHQTYVVANGGHERGLAGDPSIDNVRFPGIVRVLGKYLAKQNYFPAREGKAADLMLVIYWGTTRPFNDGNYQTAVETGMQGLQYSGEPGFLGSKTPSVRLADSINGEGLIISNPSSSANLESAMITLGMANQMREAANLRNASLLGFLHEINERNDVSRHAGAGSNYDDLISDIEQERYFVVIGAYDFQKALDSKTQKLLWSTRVSIEARDERFDERLPAMLANASRYFGQNSGRLVRQFQRAPRVDFGELKALGVVAESRTEKQ